MSVANIIPSGGGWTDNDIVAGANIAATKTIARERFSIELFGPTTTITALTKLLMIMRQSATLVHAEAIQTVQATGADRTVTVDIQKSTGAGAFASIMSATIGFTNSSAIRTPVAGTFSVPSLVDGDILQAVVTVAGSASAQAQGLLLSLTIDELPA